MKFVKISLAATAIALCVGAAAPALAGHVQSPALNSANVKSFQTAIAQRGTGLTQKELLSSTSPAAIVTGQALLSDTYDDAKIATTSPGAIASGGDMITVTASLADANSIGQQPDATASPPALDNLKAMLNARLGGGYSGSGVITVSTFGGSDHDDGSGGN